MKKDTLLVQCILKGDGLETTAWIEAEKAKIGHWILSSDVKSAGEPQWRQIQSVGSEKIAYEKIANGASIWDVPVNQMRGNK